MIAVTGSAEQAPRTSPTPEPTAKTVVRFPEGVPGFEQVRAFQLLENPEARPFFWLQAADEKQPRLLVVDPRAFDPDYRPNFTRHELARVGLGPADDKIVLVVVTLRPDGPTANLRAPIVVNAVKMIGAQIILEESHWPLRHPLFAAGA